MVDQMGPQGAEMDEMAMVDQTGPQGPQMGRTAMVDRTGPQDLKCVEWPWWIKWAPAKVGQMGHATRKVANRTLKCKKQMLSVLADLERALEG